MGTFKIFIRICLGTCCRRAWRTLFVCVILYGALSPLGIHLATAPFVFCLMPGVFGAGVMLHALQSKEQVIQLRHLQMLPVDNSSLVLGYVGALAAYVLLTKMAPLLTLMLTLLAWQEPTLVAALLCGLNGIGLTALAVAWRKNSWVLLPWVLLLGLLFWWLGVSWWLSAGLMASGFLCVLLLMHTDAYAFLRQRNNERSQRPHARRGLMLHYFARYLLAHKNYLVNTVALWVMALVLPLLFNHLMDSEVVASLGIALLTLNTPLGILLSCDPALERAVRVLPHQRQQYCLPYIGLIFASVLFSELLYLVSWLVVVGNVKLLLIALSGYAALQSAVANVWLEWRWPLKNWRIESDLWHHPRKYLVPGAMLLLTAAISSWPMLLLPLSLALVAEMVGWLKHVGS